MGNDKYENTFQQNWGGGSCPAKAVRPLRQGQSPKLVNVEDFEMEWD
jgi:hypothetical protein